MADEPGHAEGRAGVGMVFKLFDVKTVMRPLIF